MIGSVIMAAMVYVKDFSTTALFFFLSCCSQVGTLIWKGLQVGGQRDGKNPAAVCYLILISQSQLLAQTLRPQKINNFITARVHTHTLTHKGKQSACTSGPWVMSASNGRLHFHFSHQHCNYHTRLKILELQRRWCFSAMHFKTPSCFVLFFFKYISLRDKSRIIFWNIPKARPPSFCQ